MKENSIEKDEEILNNIKAYMQENIDKGYHKFVYNDLGYDEKCIDVINTIDNILLDYKRVLKENETYKNQYFGLIDKIENKIDKFDYNFEKAKRKNDNDRADYYWDLIRNFKKLLESEE